MASKFLKITTLGSMLMSGLLTSCLSSPEEEAVVCVENCETGLSSSDGLIGVSSVDPLSSGIEVSSDMGLSSEIALSSQIGISSSSILSSSSVANLGAEANFKALFSETQFNTFFPKRDPFYTYQGFLDAVVAVADIKVKLERRTELNYDAPQVSRWNGTSWEVLYAHVDFNASWNLTKAISSVEVNFGDFLNVGTESQRKEELMAFLAQLSHETTGRAPSDPMNGGLWFKQEVSYANGGIGYTTSSDPNFQAVSGQSYHGRGPFQISYPYNYGKFSYEMFGSNIGLTRPAFVLDSPKNAFMAAIWFWMRPQIPKPSMHDIMLGLAVDTKGVNGASSRFGWTTNVINGGLECGIPNNSSSVDRQNYFKHYMSQVSLTPESNLSCAQMSSY